MYQTDRGTYQKESFGQQFCRSCLGRFIIAAVAVAAIAFIASLSVPADEDMLAKTEEGISLCIDENAISKSDKIDDAVRNFTAIFTGSDSAATERNMTDFYRFNRIEIYRHAFYSTARIHSNFHPEGTRASIGIFGMVIPTVSYDDILMRVLPIRKEYNQRILNIEYGSDDDLGSNPDFGNTYNTYEGGGSE
ncbi:MAG: hypothetical protein J6K19_11220 [Prevotella sp.]|nr:hypothetical protein [Prevotella sp.]